MKKGRRLVRVYRSRRGDIRLGEAGHEDTQKVKEVLRYLDTTIRQQEEMLEGYLDDYRELLKFLPEWERNRWLGRKRTPEM